MVEASGPLQLSAAAVGLPDSRTGGRRKSCQGPRVAATSETKCPSIVLSPPAPFVKVTSVEKATSSSTAPQDVQQLQPHIDPVAPARAVEGVLYRPQASTTSKHWPLPKACSPWPGIPVTSQTLPPALFPVPASSSGASPGGPHLKPLASSTSASTSRRQCRQNTIPARRTLLTRRPRPGRPAPASRARAPRMPQGRGPPPPATSALAGTAVHVPRSGWEHRLPGGGLRVTPRPPARRPPPRSARWSAGSGAGGGGEGGGGGDGGGRSGVPKVVESCAGASQLLSPPSV